MAVVGGIVVGFIVWVFLFLVLPQEFLGTVVGRPFELDDGELIIRYPWGMVLLVLGFFALPIAFVKFFSRRS